jgi:hypothetical protein
VTGAVACKVVLAFAVYEPKTYADKSLTPLFRCVGGSQYQPGHPVVGQRRFDGWNVSIVSGALTFSKGTSSFSVGGTDFGAYCG